MSSQLLCRIVFGSYFALFALWLALYSVACCVNQEIRRGLLWMLPVGLCTFAAIWAYSRLEDFGYSVGVIGLLFLLALLLQAGGWLRASLRRHDKPES